MCPSQLFSFFFVFLLLLFFINSSEANTNTSFAYCPSFICHGRNISYPFWNVDSFNSTSSQYCGYPGFGIHCSKTNPILNISNDSFCVKHIDYSTYSLTLVDIDAFDSTDCPRIHHNLTLGDLSLKYSELDMNLTFYINCTNSLSSGRRLDCLNSGGNKSYSFIEDNEPDDLNWYEICEKKVVATVMDSEWNRVSLGAAVGEELTKGLVAAMGSGFVLDWWIATECGKCEASDGRCGYNNITDESLCYCKDGTVTSDHCNGKIHLLKLTTGISVAGIGILIVFGIMYTKYRKSFRKCIRLINGKTEDQSLEAILKQYGSLAIKRYSYREIKKMTHGFNDKLGEGGYGGVYKGILANGHVVAVKILKATKGDGEEFINEVASISRTSHVNVVSLLGYCVDGSKRALIYDFMPNGSLEKYIYSDGSHLGLQRLYQIAVGIAKGLEYLHRGCNTRILHFDIKPHNILLDEEFCPKISDFGLAKLCTRKESIVSMLGARGTIGYIAPEVISRSFGGVSHKSDVYSYGMMVLEMAGGRKNVKEEVSHTSEIYFPYWAYQHVQLDNELKLLGIINKEEEETARKMILVGLWCIQTDPAVRPSMSKVIDMFEGNLTLEVPPKPLLCTPYCSGRHSLSVQGMPP